ncbi:MAG TPA: hypothetical protein VF316_13440 [Polyangiaceae bacterium]
MRVEPLGYTALGPFAAEELGIAVPTFAKYKKAGKAVSDFKPKLFDEVISAVANGRDEPTLPEVSALAELPSISKRLGAKQAAETVDLVFQGAGLRTAKGLSQFASYGTSTPAEKQMLHQLDDFVASAERVQAVLARLDNGDAASPKGDLLHERLVRIQEVCARTYDLAGERIK